MMSMYGQGARVRSWRSLPSRRIVRPILSCLPAFLVFCPKPVLANDRVFDKDWETPQRKVRCFPAAGASYHNIASKMIARDLELAS